MREAIAQLAIEGLVRHEAGVGTYAVRIDDSELRELYDLRTALECHALDPQAGRLDALDVAALKRANEALRALTAAPAAAGEPPAAGLARRAAWEQHDAEFHTVLVRRAGNGRLKATLEGLRSRALIFGANLPVDGREARAATCREHDAILDALARGKMPEARERLAEHLAAELRHLLESRTAVDARA